VAGRYEGIDERLIDTIIDEELSIGDYVLSGGELPAMVLIDGLTRLQAGAVGDVESVINDSFVSGLLDYPQYTRPEAVSGESVPGVLLSGNHKEIERWRLQQSLGRTFDKRPDLLKDIKLSELEQDLLDTYLAERKIED
jgi:tRNA (guanine37-N1)-methyltransferase